MANIVTVANVQGYLDEQNTAWLNAEDVARGFGFTYQKNGIEYVRWERVNEYLESFGYFGTNAENSPRVAKGDYIPENMVYRLGFKANNEAAVRFQSILADDVLPSIRKTGQYAVKPLTQGQMLVQMAQAYEAQERMLLEQQRRQSVIEHKVEVIENRIENNGFMSVMGFANIHHLNIGTKAAAAIGRLASKWCKRNLKRPEKTKHERWGAVNTYPMEALRMCFAEFYPDKEF